MPLPSLDDYFPDWKEREALAEAMIPIIGRLYRSNVVTYCYSRALYLQSVVQIMKTHRYVRQVAHNELSEFESYPILDALSQRVVAVARLVQVRPSLLKIVFLQCLDENRLLVHL